MNKTIFNAESGRYYYEKHNSDLNKELLDLSFELVKKGVIIFREGHYYLQ